MPEQEENKVQSLTKLASVAIVGLLIGVGSFWVFQNWESIRKSVEPTKDSARKVSADRRGAVDSKGNRARPSMPSAKDVESQYKQVQKAILDQ
jgi:hypothetical protein